MNNLFADRMARTHKSFIREILKVTVNPEVISFAGGLPNPDTFPVQQVAQASRKVLSEHGQNVLQYSTTEGYLPLREFIADRYIRRIREVYKAQRDLMVATIEKSFPQEVKHTRPEGGMFLWITLPEDTSSLELFELARKENVAFVPGKAFYVDGGGDNTLRLNFSNSHEEKIEEGIKRLAKVIKKLIMQNR
jgi:DNA-binding transcriptional MocR family regulator